MLDYKIIAQLMPIIGIIYYKNPIYLELESSWYDPRRFPLLGCHACSSPADFCWVLYQRSDPPQAPRVGIIPNGECTLNREQAAEVKMESVTSLYATDIRFKELHPP